MGRAGLNKDSHPLYFFILCRRMYKTPFVYSVLHDGDREKDGRQMRSLYSQETGEAPEYGPANVLEVLVALAIRTDEWLSGGEYGPYSWFMTMLHNLRLDGFTDDILMEPGAIEQVDAILEAFIERRYGPDGTGGLFPLREPDCDQRQCDIEYQLQCYLRENRHLIGTDID